MNKGFFVGGMRGAGKVDKISLKTVTGSKGEECKVLECGLLLKSLWDAGMIYILGNSTWKRINLRGLGNGGWTPIRNSFQSANAETSRRKVSYQYGVLESDREERMDSTKSRGISHLETKQRKAKVTSDSL